MSAIEKGEYVPRVASNNSTHCDPESGSSSITIYSSAASNGQADHRHSQKALGIDVQSSAMSHAPNRMRSAGGVAVPWKFNGRGRRSRTRNYEQS